MRRCSYQIGGVWLRVEADDGPALRGLARLLAGCPRVEEPAAGTAIGLGGSDRGGGALVPEVRLTLRFEPRPCLLPGGALPLIRHGEIRVLADGGGLWLSDGWSRLWVDAAAGRAEAEVHPGSWSGSEGFVEGLLRLGLLELLRGQGCFPLRAAVLLAGEVGIVVAGSAGCGKSTLAEGWARSGGVFLGDDMALLRGGPNGVLAEACPRAARPDLAAPDPRRVAAPPMAGAGRPWPAPRVQAECRPGVLLLPVVRPGATRVEPLSAREALAALLPASPLLLAHRSLAPPHLEALRSLAEQCRCYRLFQGQQLLCRPHAVGDLLRGLVQLQEWLSLRG
jgi:hypothetical protein